MNPKAELKTRQCLNCGGQLNNEFRSGSLTAWLFRPKQCSCSRPLEPVSKERTQTKLCLKEMTGDSLDACANCGVTLRGMSHDCQEEDFNRPSPLELSLVGKTINKKYRVVGFIGRGGMSVVYQAKNIHTDQYVALKLLRSHLISDDSSLQRFQREAKAVSSLSHKNIIRMFDFGLTEDEQPFLAVEFLTGFPLSQLIKESGPFDCSVAINWFCQIADALKEAHKQGIVHRDVKPSNIIVGTEIDGSETVRILDFGISKVLLEESGQSKLTQTGEIFGSPMYMSPEQCLGKALDGRSDIYSLGTLMYEVLSGTPPLVGENVLDTLNKQLSSDPVSLVECRPETPESIDYVVMRCLMKEPSKRYQSAAELLSDLLLVKDGKLNLNRVGYKRQSRDTQRWNHDLKKRVGTVVTIVLCVVVFVVAAGFGYSLDFKRFAKRATSGVQGSAAATVAPLELSEIRAVINQLILAKKFETAISLLRVCLDSTDVPLERADYSRTLAKCLIASSSDGAEALKLYRYAYQVYNPIKIFPADRADFLREYAFVLKSANDQQEQKAVESQLLKEFPAAKKAVTKSPTKIVPLPADVAEAMRKAKKKQSQDALFTVHRSQIAAISKSGMLTKGEISDLYKALTEAERAEQRARNANFPEAQVRQLNTRYEYLNRLLEAAKRKMWRAR